MVYLLGGLCAVLALTAAALAVKIALLRRAARELREGLTERLEGEDTNTLLTLPTRDRDMRALASDLNGQLRLLRERRHRYQQGDLTVKEAVTEVAHDLRTPLTAIRGYLDLLEGDVPAEDRARYHSLIRRRVEGMTELTEELLRTSLVLSAPQPRQWSRWTSAPPWRRAWRPSTPRFSGGASRPRWPSLRNRWSAPWTARP